MPPVQRQPLLQGISLAVFSIFATLSFFICFVLISAGIIGTILITKWSAFSQQAQLSTSELGGLALTALTASPAQTQNISTFLILGTDQLSTRGDATILTDTIMLASLNHKTGKVTLISLPRDLWSQTYQSRINALYSYGLTQLPTAPTTLITNEVAALTGIPIHYTVVVSLNQVATLIDLLGGVEVTVQEGFTDTQFPRPDIDVTTETDPAILYKTVVFEPGTQTLSGERSLEFIRSRKSQGDEGTDEARAARQQQVIIALVTKLRSSQIITDTTLLAKLWRWYTTEFGRQLPPSTIASFSQTIWSVRNTLTIERASIPIFPDNESGIIYHPPVSQTRGQWLYHIKDATLFVSFFKNQIGIL